MQHELSESSLRGRLGASASGAAEAIERCVHCGFCLATCPTYAELADEAESPRGRIVLMKTALEGKLDLDDALPHIDSCLGCLACESSCPSGVEYGALLGPFREYSEGERASDRQRSRVRHRMLSVLESPTRLVWGSRLGWLARPVAKLLPESMRTALDLLPLLWPRRVKLAEVTEAVGERRARVVLFPGCVQQVFETDVHNATVEVLAHCGVEVVVPRNTRCCGALAAHVGELERARELARHNLEALSDLQWGEEELEAGSGFGRIDAIVTNVAGCGAGFSEYPRWLLECDEYQTARDLSQRTLDVAVFLDQLGIPQPAELRRRLRVVMQDACHLRHAQNVLGAPRRLLQRIPGLELVEASEAEVCCGSAGLYNIEQPAMAARLGRRKARKLADTGADLVVSGNVGCLLQLNRHLRRHLASEQALAKEPRSSVDDANSDPLLRLDVVTAVRPQSSARSSDPRDGRSRDTIRARHLMQILRDAYRGEL